MAVNLAGLLLFLACWVFAAMLAPTAYNLRVTELDRADVIDHEKLKAHNPELAKDVRNNLGPWIVGPEEWYFAAFGAALAGVNLVLAFFAIVRAERAEPRGGSPADGPEARETNERRCPECGAAQAQGVTT